MIIVKTNGQSFELESCVENNDFAKQIKRHYTIKFICEICGKQGSREARKFNKPIKFICGDCLVKETNLNKYGVENPAQSKVIKSKIRLALSDKNKQEIALTKRIQTYKEKTGYSNPSHNPDVKDKRKITNFKKYGYAFPMQNKEIKSKMQETNLEKYGVENVSSLERTKEAKRKKIYKIFLLLLDKRNNNQVTPLFNIEDYDGSKKRYLWRCNACNNEFEDLVYNGRIPRCKVCYPNFTGTSKYEDEIFEFVSLHIKAEKNKRFFESNYKYELDIFIEEKNLGIEFNGLYWHSESLINSYRNSNGKNYHIDKYNYFKDLGIRVINIFEDEWIDKKDIVKSILLSSIGIYDKIIYARKCEVKETSKDLFLEENHIQGNAISSINLGLFYEGELVSAMIFSKPRYNKFYQYEMIRYCNKLNTLIIGGASKLLKYFERNYNPKSIISYCDIRYFTGNMYKNLDFELKRITTPNYYWTDYSRRYNRMLFQKHKLKNKLKEFHQELTEEENMILNGYDRIFDCGNLVFTHIFLGL